MDRFITIFCLFAIFQLPPWSFAQDIDHTIEAVVDIEEGSAGSEDLPILDALRQMPLDINKADRIDWEQLPWIPPDLAQAIVDWRGAYGPFLNRRILIRVPGMSESILDRLAPFVNAGSHTARTHGRWRMTNSRRDRHGARGNGRLGIQSDVNIRERFRWGMRFERRIPNRGYRWQSGYALIHGARVIDQFLVGRFEMDFGQGLIWRSRSTRPSLSTFSASVKRRSRGFRPDRTTYSTGSNRGIAGRYNGRHLQFIGTVFRNKKGEWTHGGRWMWAHQRGVIGTSIAVKGKTYLYGLDMDILVDQTNLFGELVFNGRQYAVLQAGIIWRLGNIESGLAAHHEPRVYYLDDTAKSWSILLLRWKPDQRTVVQLSIEPQRKVHYMLLKRTVRLRHRWRYGIILSGAWRQEKDEQQVGAGVIHSRWQSQVEGRIRGRIQWRGRLERRRNVAEGTDHKLLISTRYRSKERVNLSIQWQYTLSNHVAGSQNTPVFSGSQRSRWTLLMQGPVMPGIEVLMRYAQTRETRHAQLKTPLMESDWSMQVSMAW